MNLNVVKHIDLEKYERNIDLVTIFVYIFCIYIFVYILKSVTFKRINIISKELRTKRRKIIWLNLRKCSIYCKWLNSKKSLNRGIYFYI